MDKISILGQAHAMYGYSIEIGNTSYETTLDERIKAAKIASSISKQEQKQITTEENLKNSVQNRLIKAKEEIRVKSVSFCSNNKVLKPPLCMHSSKSTQHGLNSLLHNYEYKSKRLNQYESSIKKTISSVVSITKKVISENSDVNKIIDEKLNLVQKNPAVPYNIMPFNLSEIVLPTNTQSQDLPKMLQRKGSDSFSYVDPQTSSVQQQLKDKAHNSDDEDSMEWEHVPENIVDKVNDFRKSKLEYEPMEWTPDSIMHSDKINLCFVLDTNIFLTDLKSVSMIIDEIILDYGYPTIVVPWQVLQELDYLKIKENELGYQARKATQWLLDVISQSHPRVKGQPMVPKSNKNPDDVVLECALSIKEKVNIVCLVTNDKILSIKSEVNGINARNSVWLRNLLVTQK